MNLICPHCRQQVTVADNISGQTTSCPQCRGPFTVPLPPPLPSVAASAPLGPMPEAAGPRVFTEPAESPPAPAWSPLSRPPAVGDYTRRLAIYFSPRVMVWLVPICFLAIFVLMFFPWAGVYGGSQYLVRQSGVQLAFGGYTEVKKDAWQKMWRSKKYLDLSVDSEAEDENLPSLWSPMILVYFFLICLGVVGVVLFVILPQAAPAVADRLRPWRPLGFTLLSFLTLLFLGLQVLFGFPLEKRLTEKIEKSREEHLKQAKENAEGYKEVQEKIDYGVSHSMLQHRLALKLVLLLNVLAMVGSLMEFALARRGLKPLPRLVLEY
jgi:hypothetical protein